MKATRTRLLRTRWSLEAAADMSKIADCTKLEDILMKTVKWAGSYLHRNRDMYEAHDDWQRQK